MRRYRYQDAVTLCYMLCGIWMLCLCTRVGAQDIPTHTRRCIAKPSGQLNMDLLRRGYRTGGAQLSLRAVRSLPVVIHVVQTSGSGISDAQILAGLERLNNALSGQPICAGERGSDDTGIRLCPARRDGYGQATTGITYHISPLADVNTCTQEEALKSLPEIDGDFYPDSSYINIYLVERICAPCIGAGCDIGGYAASPVVHGRLSDGVVLLLSDWIDSDCSRIKTALHEVGHYFGLLHTFEGGCRNENCLMDGDGVCDTPPSEDAGFYVPHPCEQGLVVNTCHSDVNAADINNPFTTDQPDPDDNLMSYAPDACVHRLTAGQIWRMNFSLDVLRSSLLLSRGCQPPCPNHYVIDAILPDSIRVGQSVTFINNSSAAPAYRWTVNGQSYTSTDLTMVFDSAGDYRLSLEIIDGPACSLSRSWTIHVRCGVTAAFSFDDQAYSIGDTLWLHYTPESDIRYHWLPAAVRDMGNGLAWYVIAAGGTTAITLSACDGRCCSSFTRYVYSGECQLSPPMTWYLGDYNRMDFTGDTVMFSTTAALNSYEGSAMGYDSQGRMLFYFNGHSLWNRDLQLMAGSTDGLGYPDMLGNESATQILTVRQPGSATRWWLFYTDGTEGGKDQPLPFYYALVDMGAEAGLGRVLQKNILIYPNSSEKLMAIRHCNGRDWWLLTHPMNSDAFYIYRVDTLGWHPTPLIQHIGLQHGSHASATAGFIKADAGGHQIAVTKGMQYDAWGQNRAYDGSLELFHFDRRTGRLSDPLVIEDSLASCYSVEFSPSGRNLYSVTNPKDSFKYYLNQYDISNWDAATIRSSRYTYDTDLYHSSFGGLQTGPDGRIYIPSTQKWISVIRSPDERGLAADFVSMALITNDYSGYGIPTFPADIYVRGGGLTLSGATTACLGDTLAYRVQGGCDDSHYQFESSAGMRQLVATRDSLRIIATDTGRVWIAVRREDACAARNDTLWLQVRDCGTQCTPSYSITESHTRICRGEQAYLRLHTPADSIWIRDTATVLWQPIAPGLIDLGTPTTDRCYAIRMRSVTGCDTTIRVSVSVGATPALYIDLPDSSVCRSAVITLPVTTDADTIAWSDAQGRLLYSGAPRALSVGPFGVGDSCFVLRAIGAGGCDSLLTVCIPLRPPGIIHSDTVGVCAGDSALIQGVWRITPGSYAQSYTTADYCDSLSIVSLSIFTPPLIHLDIQDPTCFGTPGSATISLSPGNGTAQIRWSDPVRNGWNQPVLVAGDYRFTITDGNGCTESLSFTIDSVTAIHLDMPTDTTIMAGDAILLLPDISNCPQCIYHWDPPVGLSCTDCEQPLATPQQTSQYVLTVRDTTGCTVADSIHIRIVREQEHTDLFIPNVFTPNHDGVNDELTLSLASGVTLLSMSIYDRWGGVKYSCKGTQCRWDGMYRGHPVDPGTYVVMIRYRDTAGAEQVIARDVTVVR